MKKSKTVDEYIVNAPVEYRELLASLRALIIRNPFTSQQFSMSHYKKTY